MTRDVDLTPPPPGAGTTVSVTDSRPSRSRRFRGERASLWRESTRSSLRVSAHSSSDDPSRYRDEAVTDVWKTRRDPIRRLRTLLEVRGWLATGEHDALAARYEAEVREVIAAQGVIGPPPASSLLFDDVYEQPTWLLREQRGQLLG